VIKPAVLLLTLQHILQMTSCMQPKALAVALSIE
jgi:hypothetical protein